MTVIDSPEHRDALENQFGLADRVVDEAALANSVDRFRERGITLPTFAQLADPSSFDHAERVGDADHHGQDARNLWRVHWYNDLAGGRVDVPQHVVLPTELTGVESPIIVVFGDRFPMITAHKVLAAYSCLAPRVVTGQFDPTHHRAIWPSTGNYARGGIAISRIMASRGVAILPEGMSQERFDWLQRWCENPDEDVIRTFGTESNVKEIYDACNELAEDPGNFVLNQFSEFGNHLGHYTVTGRALGHAFETVRAELHASEGRDLHLAAFASATGSAGTIAAGDRLKDDYGARIVAVEALECPTMLENGYGEHNIQGIGDKHIPLIHNVMNTDVVCAISDVATDELDVLFNTDQGREYLSRSKGLSDQLIDALPHFGFSSICNTLAAIKTAKLLDLGPEDALITVATDGGELYPSERAKTLTRRYHDEYSHTDAAEAFGQHLGHVTTEHMIDMTEADRRRVFQLGYYTWVEQQGTPFELFEERRSQDFWRGLRRYVGVWDEMIDEFNQRVAEPAGR
ncbi:MAG: pyridoxal-5'-phosphate-dependent protein subunit beta [Ilumatobacter sp.]|uniref:pyridoxal-phosphate dependent enzyme n=1 Tax=Ilumatobacter sp. TaxID=1967498 RepID=UPI0026341DC5|nr:pyridoxal-phosphate dependent enzyme [Ilumatobacter sp.]MDJ0770600.1 pyridoxal-5'-phosphate-dependent protein subunit beta [Ilumatobacter sp.]